MTRAKVPPQNPILPEHRALFEKLLHEWQDKMGLADWRITLSPKRPTKGAAADVECFAVHRMAKVRLADDAGNSPVTVKLLEGLAVHELSHILLHPLISEELEGEALEAAEHGVIHIIQKLLTGTHI